MNDTFDEVVSPRGFAVPRLLTVFAIPLFALAVLLFTPQTASAQFGNVTLANTPVSGSSMSTPAATLNWSHTIPNSANRCLVVSIAIHRTNGVLPTTTSITYGAQGLTQIQAAAGNSQDLSKRTEIWVLVAPAIGVNTITVNLSSTANVVGASYSFASVDQAAPVFNAGNNAAINTASASAAVLAICPSAFSQSAIVDVVAVEATNTATPLSGQMNVHSQTTTSGITTDNLLGRGGDVDPPGGQFNVMQYGLGAIDFWVMSTLTLNPAALTAVGLESFEASSYEGASPTGRSGGVMLAWRSGQEANNLGFRIYRERNGQRVPVSSDIIAGSSLFSPVNISSGYKYAWWDAAGRSGDTYWLEDVDLSGNTTLHGPYKPATVSGGAPAKANSPILGELSSAATSGQMVWDGTAAKAGSGHTTPPNPNTQWQLASTSTLKIGVRQTGWYRLSQQDLLAAGFGVTAMDPRTLKLYVDGREIPIRITGESDGRFDSGDTVEFFGTALDIPTTDTQVYWLASTAGTGQRIKAQLVKVAAGAPVSYPAIVEVKERLVYFASLQNGETENFFGKVVSTTPADHSISITNLDPAGTSVLLDVAVQGVTLVPHQVDVNVNGQYVGQIAFTEKNRGTARFTVPQSVVHEGQNVVSLSRTVGGDPTDVSLVDSIRLAYTHRATADQNIAVVNVVSRQGARSIDGFTSSQVQAFDVTNPFAVQELAGPIVRSANGYAITVQPGASTRRVLALTPDRALQPASLVLNQASSWNARTNAADVVILTHHDFASSVAPLKAFRESQGYRVAVVDVEDLYDEFTAGVRSPQAIRSFVGQARSTWATAPRFVVLVGDGSLDPRNYLGAGNFSFIPTKQIDGASLEFASDDWLVDANADDLPDVAVGRLPVRSASEASTIVSKIIAYESAGTANRSAMLVSDITDISDFSATSAEIHGLLPSDFAISEVNRGTIGDDVAARQAVLSGADSGPGIVNFVGHGNVDLWRGGLLTSTDAGSLNNSGRLSLYVVANCLNGYYQDPLLEGLGEALLKAPNGGAVAVWASSGASGPEGQRVLVEEFYRTLFAGQNLTIGEVAARAKAAAAGDVRRSWVLLGDPVTRLK